MVLRASALLFEFHLRVNAVRTVRRKPCGTRSFSLASESRGKEPPSSKVLAPFREPPSPSTSLSGGRGGPFLVTRCLALAGGKQSRSDGAESDTSPALTLNFAASVSISQSRDPPTCALRRPGQAPSSSPLPARTQPPGRGLRRAIHGNRLCANSGCEKPTEHMLNASVFQSN